MGKIFDKLMNTMRLNGDDYDEEFDDNIDDDFDDSFDDDFDGEYNEPEEMPKKTFTSAAKSEPVASKPKNIKPLKTTSSRKIVPINGTQNIQEVRVVRPANYDAAREIVDVLLDGQACIVNLEGISFDLAAQITDFIFNSCNLYRTVCKITVMGIYSFAQIQKGAEIYIYPVRQFVLS